MLGYSDFFDFFLDDFLDFLCFVGLLVGLGFFVGLFFFDDFLDFLCFVGLLVGLGEGFVEGFDGCGLGVGLFVGFEVHPFFRF